MTRTLLLFAVAPLSVIAVGPGGGIPYRAETHQAVKSSGCGKSSPYSAGRTVTATATYAGLKWTYLIYVPSSYDQNTPMPVILQHPGWGMTAKSEESGAGITYWAESKGFISVTPQGNGDNTNRGGPWYSWNAAGTTQSPGPAGPTCSSKGNSPSYCYTSCAPCNDSPQCWWTTCTEEVTPTGVGTKNVGGFIPGLYNTLESQLCIDTTREYAAGESNGGMMAYQLGVSIASRLAAIAPQFGSFQVGFNAAPSVGVPVMDIHGKSDTTVPANVSLSGDGYYYTPVSQIFGGNAYSQGWDKSNGCTGSARHYPTAYDGIKGLWCAVEGTCSGGDVVRCAYTGGHNWFNGGGKDNGGLVTDFMLKWSKPSHIGLGYSEGHELGEAEFLEDVTIVEDIEEAAPEWTEQILKPKPAGGHYGNPASGCQKDEDVVNVGTGIACAPRIGTKSLLNTEPEPSCTIGGATPDASNGCPVDANIAARAKSWPICLGKGNTTDPYTEGNFHCLLVCPCQAGHSHGKDGKCSVESHAHCPLGASCERGELRKRDQGVCTYSAQGDGEVGAVVV